MSDPTSAPVARSPLWMRVLLGVSLALNLLVAGLAVGAFARMGGPGGAHPAPRSLGGAMYRALPREDRRDLLQQVRASDKPRTPGRVAQAEEIATVLRATPYDGAAMQVVVMRQLDGRQAWQTAMQAAWLERVAAMSPQERAAFADRLEEAATHKKHKRGKADKKGD